MWHIHLRYAGPPNIRLKKERAKVKKYVLLGVTTFGFMLTAYSQSSSQREPAPHVNVAVLIYDGVELLDFAGPLEVFSLAHGDTSDFCTVYTVALSTELIQSQKVLQIKPQYTLDNCPAPDVVVLPGGDTRAIRENEKLIRWLQDNIDNIDIALSVCTGASILGEAGLLENQTATTHKYAIERMQAQYVNTTFLSDKRVVDNGKIVTTAGISAGIDGSLYVVRKLFGKDVSDKIVDWMEYDNSRFDDTNTYDAR